MISLRILLLSMCIAMSFMDRNHSWRRQKSEFRLLCTRSLKQLVILETYEQYQRWYVCSNAPKQK